MSRSDWASRDVMEHILAALTDENRLAVTVSLVTGLRIGDVLNLKTDCLKHEKFTITEEKTLKRRSVRLPARLRDKLLAQAGKIYIFENRLSARKHRTRQAVYKDIKRAARAFRCKTNITCHTARKVYAVEEYHKDFSVARVKRLLNHSSEAVTMIYAIADDITERRAKFPVLHPHSDQPRP